MWTIPVIIDVWADTSSEASVIADRVIELLDECSISVDASTFHQSVLETDNELEPDPESGHWRRSLRFSIHIS